MTHYDITIIGKSIEDSSIVEKLKDKYKVLFIEKGSHTRYRNSIKTENGYIVILNKEKKNIQISTGVLIVKK